MPEPNGRNGLLKGPIPWLVAGGVGLGGTGAVVNGFQINSARIDANQTRLERVEAHNKDQDAITRDLGVKLNDLRLELDHQIEEVRKETVPLELSKDRVKRFEVDLDQLERQLEGRLGRIQEEINAVRDRIGSRRGPD